MLVMYTYDYSGAYLFVCGQTNEGVAFGDDPGCSDCIWMIPGTWGS